MATKKESRNNVLLPTDTAQKEEESPPKEVNIQTFVLYLAVFSSYYLCSSLQATSFNA